MTTREKLARQKRLDRALKVCDRLGYTNARAFPTVRVGRNPFSGRSCHLSPAACDLYLFITTRRYTCGKDYTRTEWDTARRVFLEQWRDAYYILID